MLVETFSTPETDLFAEKLARLTYERCVWRVWSSSQGVDAIGVKRTSRGHASLVANDPLLPSGPPIIGTAQMLSEPLSASLPMAMIQRVVRC
jgi:hypothetical protein